MSIRAYVNGKEVLQKPRGYTPVKISSGWAGSESIVSFDFKVLGEDRSVWIGGNDLERMLKVLATDPRYERLFHPAFVEQEKVLLRRNE